MRAVSRFESDLLRLLHALLGRSPIEGVLPLIAARHERPACLSPDAVALVQDALAKGCVLRLAREGGWRQARHLRGERAVSGRLWERSEPEALGLHFSARTLELLLTLMCHHPGDCLPGGATAVDGLTVGDQFVFFMAYESLRETPIAEPLWSQSTMFAHGLCRLAFPEDFTEESQSDPPDFAPWTEGLGSTVLEALQPLLAGRWASVEEQKSQIDSAARLRAVSEAQARVLDAFLTAVETAGRRDLARFVLVTASGLLGEHGWQRIGVNPRLLEGLRLFERIELQRTAQVLVPALRRLRSWEQDARGIGYFDDGYAAAQLWKADWEAHAGQRLCERADSLRQEIDPLHSSVREAT